MSCPAKRVKHQHNDASIEPLQGGHPLPTLSFHSLPDYLPNEIAFEILHAWIAPQRLLVYEHSTNDFQVDWSCATDLISSSLAVLPTYLSEEYDRLRILSWLTYTKDFRAPYDFYMSHFCILPPPRYLLDVEPWTTLEEQGYSVQISRYMVARHPQYQLHGLEKLRLDFDAEQYFAMFDVAVPPFDFQDEDDSGDNLYHDAFCHGAATFLEHTKDLTLHFGTAYKYCNPWYNVGDDAWHSTSVDWVYGEARWRPKICESGMVIDWILSYAWHHQFLQHVPKITLTGDIQPWVRNKWHDIFARQAEHNAAKGGVSAHADAFAVHKPDIHAIATIGMAESGDDDWCPEAFYPPPCTCEIGCWRLHGGRVEDEVVARSWDQVASWSDTSIGNWWVDDEGMESVVW